jgi:methionyl-tRNA formyltransferase
MNKPFTYVFFGSSPFSEYVLDELKNADYFPLLDIKSAKEPLPSLEELKKLDADVFIVASFGKILPAALLAIPKHGSLNVHPSLLPELRGPAPIQGTILGQSQPGVTIIKMDEQMDHGPIVAQTPATLEPFPDHYATVESALGHLGGQLLADVLPAWIEGTLPAVPQDESAATYIKLIKKEDGLLNLEDSAETNYRKVLAYSTWPGAYMFFTRKTGEEIRLVVKDAEIKDGVFTPLRVVPAGKKEMDWESFLRGNA